MQGMLGYMRRNMLFLLGGRGGGAEKLVHLFCGDFSGYPDQALDDGQILDMQKGQFLVKDTADGNPRIEGGRYMTTHMASGTYVKVGLSSVENFHSYGDKGLFSWHRGELSGLNYIALGMSNQQFPNQSYMIDGFSPHTANGIVVSVVNALSVRHSYATKDHFSGIHDFGVLFSALHRFFLIDGELIYMLWVDSPKAYSHLIVGEVYGGSAICDAAKVIDLPASGYEQVKRDYTELTDSGGVAVVVNCENNCELRSELTGWPVASDTNLYARMQGSIQNAYKLRLLTSGEMILFLHVAGDTPVELGSYTPLSTPSTPVITWVLDEERYQIWLNGELCFTLTDSTHLYGDSVGYNELVNTLSFPYPALGSADGRVIYPEDARTNRPWIGTDSLVEFLGVDISGTTPGEAPSFVFRHVEGGAPNDQFGVWWNSDGKVAINKNDGGSWTDVIVSADGALSSGGKIVVWFKGNKVILAVDDIHIGEHTGLVPNGVSGGYVWALHGTKIEHIASWPINWVEAGLIPVIDSKCG